jgi:hypothetical protein
MKKLLSTIMFVFFVLSASSVLGTPDATFAEGTSTPGTLVSVSGNTLTLGSISGSTYSRGMPIEAVLNIAANESVSGVTLELVDTSTKFSLADFDLSVSDVDENISINGETLSLVFDGDNKTTVTVRGELPLDLNSGSGKIGELRITGNNGFSEVVSINYEAESRLDFEEVEITVDGEKSDVTNGRDSDKAHPLDSARLSVKLRNLFDQNDGDEYDVKIESVEVNVVIEEFDNEGDDDLELYDEINDIREDDTERVQFEFDIPYWIEERNYDVTITVEGEDENGAIHTKELTFTIDGRLDKKAMYFDKLLLHRTALSCEDTKTALEVSLINIGEDQLEEVALVVENDELGIYEEVRNIDLYPSSEDIEDGTLSRTFSIEIPEDADPDTYTLDVMVYISGDALWMTKEVELDVNPCPADEEEDSGSIVVEDQQPPANNDPIDITPVVTNPVDGNVVAETTDNSLQIGLLAALNVVLLLAVVGLLVVVLRKRH